ncbi:MAG: DUF3576 domain-containing protein [Caulobacteraceae bacterium]
MVSKRVILAVAAIALAGAGLSGCGTVRGITGGGAARVKSNAPTPTIGVNGYLWRATLDTLSFMPLQSADPWGGTVITDWYSNPEAPGERFKVTVYILDTRLRADGLKVTVFKEVQGVGGNWVTANTAGQTETEIQNSILTRARQLRLSNVRN